MTTYEFTAFKESDLIGSGDNSLNAGDVFTMPGAATTHFSVTDNDIRLSGDRNNMAMDWSGQTAVITDGASGDDIGTDSQIYIQKSSSVMGSDGRIYRMIEIEQEGVADGYFTFYGAVPDAGVELTVLNDRDAGGSNWARYNALSAGDLAEFVEPLSSISGRLVVDADGDNTEWNAQTQNWENGVEGKLIQLLDADGNVVAETTTDSYGHYKFDVPAGDYRVKFPVLDGYKFAVKDVGHYGSDSDADSGGVTDAFHLGEGQHVTDIDAAVQPVPIMGSVGGRLVVDADGDNTEWNAQTQNWENGVEGKLIQLLDADGNVVAETTTDSYGHYKFDVPAGDYRVKFPVLDGYKFAVKDVGHYGSDSDADSGGVTDAFHLGEGQHVTDIDAAIQEVPDEPPIAAVDDFIIVSESETTGDREEILDGFSDATGAATLLENDETGGASLVRIFLDDGSVVEDVLAPGAGSVSIDLGAQGGSVEVFADGSVDFSADGDFEDLEEGQTRDVSFRYEIVREGAPATKYNLAFVIDISNSTVNGANNAADVFDGESVGDVNGDGVSDTVLDAELAAVIAAVNKLTAAGADPADIDIGIMTFSGVATGFATVNAATLMTSSGSTEFSLDDPELMTQLKAIQSGGWTNYEAGLQEAEAWFAGQAGDGSVNKVIFLSDGRPAIGTTGSDLIFQSAADYGDEVTRLATTYNATIDAVGVGANSDLGYLNEIDTNGAAIQVTDASTLSAALENIVGELPLAAAATVNVRVVGEYDAPPIAAVDDFIIVSESETTGDREAILDGFSDATGAATLLENDETGGASLVRIFLDDGSVVEDVLAPGAGSVSIDLGAQGGSVEVFADGSVDFSADGDFEDLEEGQTRDVSFRYEIVREGAPATKYNLAFVIDISNSTVNGANNAADVFDGESVGDVNGDGVSDTVLDAELAAVIAAVNKLNAAGADPADIDIGIMTFSGVATGFATVNAATLMTSSGSTEFSLDDPELMTQLKAIQSGGWTNYEAGLQEAEAWFAGQAGDGSVNKVIFLSDGRPAIGTTGSDLVFQSAADYGDEVTRLATTYNATIDAVGVGANSDLGYLNEIDTNGAAIQVTDASTLSAALENIVGELPLAAAATVNVRVVGEYDAPPIAAVDDFIIVSESETTGDREAILDGFSDATGAATLLENDETGGASLVRIFLDDGSVVEDVLAPGAGSVSIDLGAQGGSVEVFADGSVDFSADGDFEDLEEGQTRDVSFRYEIVREGAPATKYNLAFVIDISNSTVNGANNAADVFDGESVGDVNGDGVSDTVLDAELAAVIAAVNKLNAAGADPADIDIGIMTFSGVATGFATVNAATLMTSSGSTEFSLDDPELMTQLKAIQSGGWTNYEAGLQEAEAWFAGQAGDGSVNKVIFLSDGRPAIGATGSDLIFQSAADYGDEVTRLATTYNATIDAVGVGANSDLGYLNEIDTNGAAIQVTDASTLSAALENIVGELPLAAAATVNVRVVGEYDAPPIAAVDDFIIVSESETTGDREAILDGFSDATGAATLLENDETGGASLVRIFLDDGSVVEDVLAPGAGSVSIDLGAQGGSVEVFADGSVDFSADGDFEDLEEGQTRDVSFRYEIVREGAPATKYNLAFVIDISNSTVNGANNAADVFDGESVGDVNGDGVSDTVLDAELAAVIAAVNKLNAAGADPADIDIGIMTFSGVATGFATVNAATLMTSSGSTEFSLDDPELMTQLKAIQSGGWTNYEAGLQEAEAWFAGQAGDGSVNKVIFLSDGRPAIGATGSDLIFQSAADYGDEVTRLATTYNATIDAVGVGANSDLGYLNEIDTNGAAIQVTDASTLSAALENIVGELPLAAAATVNVRVVGEYDAPPIAAVDDFIIVSESETTGDREAILDGFSDATGAATLLENDETGGASLVRIFLDDGSVVEDVLAPGAGSVSIDLGAQGGSVEVFADGSVDFSADGDFEDLEEGQTRDVSFRYEIVREGAPATKYNLAFVIDISNSTVNGANNAADVFDGESVGDVNGDGVSDTVLDAELAAVIAAVNKLNAAGADPADIDIGIMTFSGVATGFATVNAATLMTSSGSTEFSLDDPELMTQLKAIQSGGWTNYEAGLQEAEAWFAGQAGDGSVNKVIFLSDGRPAIGATGSDLIFQSAADYGDEVTRLATTYNATIDAVGVGANSDLGYLNEIDTNGAAIQVTDASTLSAALENIVGELPLAAAATVNVRVVGENDTPELTLTPAADGDEGVVFEAGLDNGTNAGVAATSEFGVIEITDGDGPSQVRIASPSGTITLDAATAGASGFIDGPTWKLLAEVTDDGNVAYEFQLLAASPDGDDQGRSFDITVVDTDGEEVTASLDIAIVDDAPQARDDIGLVDVNGVAVGDVILGDIAGGVADIQGADGATVGSIAANGGWAQVVDASGATVVTTANGELSIAADGSYRFTRDANSKAAATEVFTYELVDSDGDVSEATLTIDLPELGRDVYNVAFAFDVSGSSAGFFAAAVVDYIIAALDKVEAMNLDADINVTLIGYGNIVIGDFEYGDGINTSPDDSGLYYSYAVNGDTMLTVDEAQHVLDTTGVFLAPATTSNSFGGIDGINTFFEEAPEASGSGRNIVYFFDDGGFDGDVPDGDELIAAYPELFDARISVVLPNAIQFPGGQDPDLVLDNTPETSIFVNDVVDTTEKMFIGDDGFVFT